MTSRSKLYQRAKSLGYTDPYRTSTIVNLRNYITAHINALERNPEPIIIEYRVIEKTTASSIFIVNIIQQIGEYLGEYIDVYGLKHTCREAYYCNYTIKIFDDIISYPTQIPEHYYFPYKGSDKAEVVRIGELNNRIRYLKLKYSNKDDIIINNSGVYDVYIKLGDRNKYKTITIPNINFDGNYNDIYKEEIHYGCSRGNLYKILYSMSNSNTRLICPNPNVHKLLELINIKKKIRRDLIKKKLMTSIKNPSDLYLTSAYYSLFNGRKLLSFKKGDYSKAIYMLNLDTMKPTASSPIKIDISEYLKEVISSSLIDEDMLEELYPSALEV